MKRLTVRECLSQRFLKVLNEDSPILGSTHTVFAVFTSSTKATRFCGLVTEHDIVLHPDWGFCDFVNNDPLTSIKMSTTARQALSIMKKEKREVLPVLSAKGEMVGIVTQIDLLQQLYKQERAKLLEVRKWREQELVLLDTIHKHEVVHQQQTNENNLDPLTGLPSLSQIREKINMFLVHAEEHNTNGALLILDLDNFRSVNNMMSNYFGDLILQQVAIRIASNLHKNDILARKGGDEFVIVLCGLESPDEAGFMAKIILTALSYPFRLGDQDIYITGSIGISVYPFGIQHNVEVLLANADIALERAKALGKNNYQLFVQIMGDRVKQQQKKEKYLSQALKNNELFLCYQPQVEIESNRIVGMEALLRWDSPVLGLVMPNEFITIAENSGLIVPFGDWVLRTACEQAKLWQQQKHFLRMSVNLSVRQFQGIHSHSTNKFIRSIEVMLDETGLPPELLEIEITESIIMKNYAASMVMLKKLKSLGIRISCDDFGTGYSALNYIKQFPMDTIKIDKSFIDDIVSNPIDIAIIRAIIVMAQQLKIDVIAEGVESEEQLAILRDLGCDMVQGYYFSKPLSVDDASLLLFKGSIE